MDECIRIIAIHLIVELNAVIIMQRSVRPGERVGG